MPPEAATSAVAFCIAGANVRGPLRCVLRRTAPYAFSRPSTEAKW